MKDTSNKSRERKPPTNPGAAAAAQGLRDLRSKQRRESRVHPEVDATGKVVLRRSSRHRKARSQRAAAQLKKRWQRNR